jgi:predicted O-methyltransferase YrrM
VHPGVAFAPPGHFYSPLPDPAVVDQEGERLYAPPGDDGVELRVDAQLALLRELAPIARAFDWPEERAPGRRFWLRNGYFEHGDAAILYAMLRHFRPRQVIEVGSGFSSALMLDVNERDLEGRMRLTFIEPYPDRLNALLRAADRATARVVRAPVQAVPLTEFDALAANDVLFIDSSHVAKAGSDVNHLLFHVLPRLRPGVVVHVHDAFWPFEYPAAWIREGRAWNELYALHAFLQYNSAFEVLLFDSQLAAVCPDVATRLVPQLAVNPGGSLWLRRRDVPR